MTKPWCSAEKIEQAREDAAYEDWELEWIRDYIRIDPELVTQVFYGIREEKYVDEAVERAGQAAAVSLGIWPSDWWDYAYGDDDDFEEDADPLRSRRRACAYQSRFTLVARAGVAQ